MSKFASRSWIVAALTSAVEALDLFDKAVSGGPKNGPSKGYKRPSERRSRPGGKTPAERLMKKAQMRRMGRS